MVRAKIIANLIGAGTFGLAVFFGVLIANGLSNLFPVLTGGIMIVVGVVGLALLGLFGWKDLTRGKFKKK